MDQVQVVIIADFFKKFKLIFFYSGKYGRGSGIGYFLKLFFAKLLNALLPTNE